MASILQLPTDDSVLLQVTHSNIKTFASDVRFSPEMTVESVKEKLWRKCGTSVDSMRLELYDDFGAKVCDLSDNTRPFGFYSPQNGLIKLLNPCREGKKLLVLDIDYTLFDHRSPAENPLELMRPYLHEFLTAVYAEYDIIIWSATSMRWVELKMRQLGVLGNRNYKITALLDHMAMITVQSDSRGTFDCKPLGLIWGQFPEFYTSKNTIMFDDLKRNFVMNPQNGLTIRPFRKAHLNRSSDQELVKLTQYLLAIADLPDISALDHKSWEFYTEDSTKRRRHS